ncbi:MAG: exosortase/archaeosortase family protein [Isosphaeraceae bacterium]|nr:exosortase/archaeosortase family protein [Isosphaeraceae bacterium]
MSGIENQHVENAAPATTGGASGQPGVPPSAAGALADDRGGTRGFGIARGIALAVVALALGAAYAPNLVDLYQTWANDPNYSHGFLVVPVALVILWRRLAHGGGVTDARPWTWGWLLLAAVLAARGLFYEWGIEWRETATFPLIIVCLTLTLGGWRLLGLVWPAIAFLVFMLPLPPKLNGALAQPLQRVATAGTCALLKLTGLWVVPEGNVILVGKDTLEVAEACNGLSMLMCLAATVAAMTALVPMAGWKRLALLISIVPVALVSNILRITATAWAYHLFGAEVGGHYAHDAAGWLMMPTALLLVGLELGVLSWLIVKQAAGDAGPRAVLSLRANGAN